MLSSGTFFTKSIKAAIKTWQKRVYFLVNQLFKHKNNRELPCSL